MNEANKDYEFRYIERLGIKIPFFNRDWDELDKQTQLEVIRQWETERAKIPDRIKDIENEIIRLQDKMFEIEFEEYYEIHKDIVDMSSAINDLNIWFRTDGEVTKD